MDVFDIFPPVCAINAVSYVIAKQTIHAGHALTNYAQGDRKPLVKTACHVSGIALKVFGCVLGVVGSLATGLSAGFISGFAFYVNCGEKETLAKVIGFVVGAIFAGIMIKSLIEDLRQPQQVPNQDQRQQEGVSKSLTLLAQPIQGEPGNPQSYQLFIASQAQ